jgi:hypothetical protein
MATRKIQITDSSGNIYYFETQSDIVKVTSDKFNNDNVKDVLEEIEEKTVKKKCTWNDLKGV